MTRLRIFASILSVVTLLATAWLYRGGAAIGMVAAAVLAAACLAAVAPFDAPGPPQRRRVLLACLAYVGAAGIAVALGAGAGDPRVGLLLPFPLLGLALSGWAFATRNRRRSSGGWSGYFK